VDSFQALPAELTPPYGRDFFTSPQVRGEKPVFTRNEVATIFFGRSSTWIFNNTVLNPPTIDGEEIELPRMESGMVQLQLHDVELLTHAFFARGSIDLSHFKRALTIIKAIAENFHLL
jgi:hypothetical protein